MTKQSRRKIVTNAEVALKLMGGPSRVGRWWKLSHSTVCGMAKEKRISSHYTLHTIYYLDFLGYEASPRLFGLKKSHQLLPPDVQAELTKRRA